MNDADDSVVTYIIWRLDVFSKALSGIFLILFPKRNLKNKYNRTYTFLFIQSVNEYNLKLIALKKIVHPERVGGGTQPILIRESSNPRSKPLPFYIPFLT